MIITHHGITDNHLCHNCGHSFVYYGEDLYSRCPYCNSFEVTGFDFSRSHECRDPNCQGNRAFRRQAIYDDMIEALKSCRRIMEDNKITIAEMEIQYLINRAEELR